MIFAHLHISSCGFMGHVIFAASLLCVSVILSNPYRSRSVETICKSEVHLLAPPEGGNIPSHELTELQSTAAGRELEEESV